MENKVIYTWADGTIEECVICGKAGEWLIIGFFTEHGCIKEFTDHVDFSPVESCKPYRFTKLEHLTFNLKF